MNRRRNKKNLVLLLGRTRSWSAPTSMTMMATSPTAPSAVEAGKCSCVATTTAVGQYQGFANSSFFQHIQVLLRFSISHVQKQFTPKCPNVINHFLYWHKAHVDLFISKESTQLILASRLYSFHCKQSRDQT